jgi:hypothetical protein
MVLGLFGGEIFEGHPFRLGIAANSPSRYVGWRFAVIISLS